MTIFQLIGALGDGGAETLIKDYALLLKEDGYDVKIITVFPPDKNTANFRTLKNEGIQIINLFNSLGILNRIIFKFLKCICVPYLLNREITKYRPSVIHIHQANLYAIKPIAKLLSQVKLLYTCHSLPENFIGPKVKSENTAAKYLLEKANLKMIALHDDMCKEINSMFGISNTIVINNGIDFDKYKPLSDRLESKLRLETGLKESDYVVGHIGRFSTVKNHKFLINVFNELVYRKENAKLLLVGTGILEKEVRNQIHSLGLENKVVILSHRTDVCNLLQLCDIFLFPSIYEGLGIALVEAQASGLKCVVSDSINHAAILTSKTIPISLKKTEKEWVDIMLDDSIMNHNYGNLSDFNLRREIKKVEKVYNEDVN